MLKLLRLLLEQSTAGLPLRNMKDIETWAASVALAPSAFSPRHCVMACFGLASVVFTMSSITKHTIRFIHRGTNLFSSA